VSNKEIYQKKPWLSSYSEGVPEKVEYENLCLPDYLERSTKGYPDNTALIFQGYELNYTEFKEMTDRFASALVDYGVKRGDAVAILLPNMIQCVVAYYAILKIGAIVVMNNPLYSDKELHHQFNDSGAKILITLDLLGNRMIDLRPDTKIKEIIIASIGDYLPFPKNLLFPLVAKKKSPPLLADVKTAENVYKWKDVIKKYSPDSISAELNFDDIAQYQYTGGTTGLSKGVILTHGNLSKQVQQIKAWFPGFEMGQERMLGALPYFHVFGLSTAMNLSVFMAWADILVPKPQPEPLLESIRKFKPTFAPLVPTMYIGILNHPDISKTDMSSIKGSFSGSAPLPVEVIKEYEERTGSVICEGFGMTESSPVTHINPYEKGKAKPGSIGLPVSDVESRIVSIEDMKTDVAIGETGELVIRGPQVMQGYYGLKDETDNTLKDGWLHTGDIAKMDEDGYFYIVDRLKDMIISGGYNVYPRDIDEVLYQHPKVEEACAIGIPHPVRGEAIKAFIVLKSGESAEPEEFIDFCKDKLAKYKWPEEIELRNELPKTSVGKILRKDLRAQELEKRKKETAKK